MLIQLTTDANLIDEQLAELQPTANASHVGSKERQRYHELRSESEAAWQLVLDRVVALKSLTDDLRRPLPEEQA